VHDSLLQRGFSRDWSREGKLAYDGLLDPSCLKIPVSIEVADLDFLRPPPIFIKPEYTIEGRSLPHVLGPDRAVCYYANGVVVLDRYRPGATVLQCLDQAERVVRDGVRGRSNADFADEFQAYWATSFTLVDLPEGYTGPASITYVVLNKGGRPTPVLSAKSSWLVNADRRTGKQKGSQEPVAVVQLDGALSINPGAPWPPNTFAELNAWLQWAAPEVIGRLEAALASSDRATAAVALRARNGTFIYRAQVPLRFQRPEFLRSRRSGLSRLMRKVAAEVAVDRSVGFRADPDYVFRRNMGPLQNLSGKRILLIGCGTIGSFFAQQLTQCGAGASGGRLDLADNDTLRPANLGRHLLGVPYLNRNKAQGCADFLLEQLPELAVESYPGDVNTFALPWSRYDLVIDATGEEALSIALNERAVRKRPDGAPHLFVWLLGNGAAARVLLTGDTGRACLKCLKPNLAGPERFRALRPDSEINYVNNEGCGDSQYAPFPVSRSVAAAAMACDLVLDWANGSPGNRFRSLIFDADSAFLTRNSSPEAMKACPACGSKP
jgi:molybdopterin/thiamine biosynthesis adenylyltransferase